MQYLHINQRRTALQLKKKSQLYHSQIRCLIFCLLKQTHYSLQPLHPNIQAKCELTNLILFLAVRDLSKSIILYFQSELFMETVSLSVMTLFPFVILSSYCQDIVNNGLHVSLSNNFFFNLTILSIHTVSVYQF